MTAACEQVHLFADGELPPVEAEEFRMHLAECEACQRELDDVIQLDELVRSSQPELPRVVSLSEAREKRRRSIPVWIAGAAAVAAGVVLAVRVQGSGSGSVDLYALGQTRPFEARLTHAGASEYRAYDVQRAAGPAHRDVPLTALATLEKKGDAQGLATGYLIRGEKDQAKAELAKAPRSPDVDSDKAAVALQGGAPDEALQLVDQVLAASPQHPQALWNRALALRELGLPLAAAETFEQVAALHEQGWSAEAASRAASLRNEARQDEAEWTQAFAAAKALALQAVMPSLDAVRRHPGLFRIYFYDAVRSAPDEARLRLLSPIAAELDKAYPGGFVTAWFERVQKAARFPQRAQLAAQYLKIVGGQKADEGFFEKSAAEPDLRQGALFLTRTIQKHLDEYDQLAGSDPWFRAIAAQERAASLQAASPLQAQQLLEKALAEARQAQLSYRAIFLASALSQLDQELHRVDRSWPLAQMELTLARATSEWQQQRTALLDLANAARFRGALALSRAYLREVLLRFPADCRNQAFVHDSLGDLAVQELKPSEARAELDATPGCGEPVPLLRALLLADVGRLAPRAGDLAKLHDQLAELRAARKLPPGEEALARHIEGRLLIESDPAGGAALLSGAISLAEALPRSDQNAQKARGYSYGILALDAGKRGATAEAVRVLARESGAPPPTKCAVGAVVHDERAMLAVLGAAGEEALFFDGARREPMDRFQPSLTPQQLQALRPCAFIDVFARPPLHGRAGLLPPELPWAYRGGRLAPAPATPPAPHELVVADVEPPASLGLPRLMPWATSTQSARVELRGSQATPSRVLSEMARATEIEIHAHGLVDLSQSDASLVALSPDADGSFALTAGVVRAQKLLGAPLVLLAACSAAQGGNEVHAPWSLPEAFLEAGARAVLASAGEIPDAQAREFFDAVRARIRGGAAPAAALRDERIAWRSRAGSQWVENVLVFD